MFKQGKKPCLVLALGDLHRFSDVLIVCGYKPHKGPRKIRDGEFFAWVKREGKRQVHVQMVETENAIFVYAHTEPAGYGLAHLWSAVRDRAHFSAGSRVLRRDMHRVLGRLR